MVSSTIKNSNQPILEDKKCPNCGGNKSKIWGNELFHKDRVCLNCGKVYQ